MKPYIYEIMLLRYIKWFFLFQSWLRGGGGGICTSPFNLTYLQYAEFLNVFFLQSFYKRKLFNHLIWDPGDQIYLRHPKHFMYALLKTIHDVTLFT